MKQWSLTKPELVVLDGPYQCPQCSGHIMLDATYLEQVSSIIQCPYCETASEVPE